MSQHLKITLVFAQLATVFYDHFPSNHFLITPLPYLSPKAAQNLQVPRSYYLYTPCSGLDPGSCNIEVQDAAAATKT